MTSDVVQKIQTLENRIKRLEDLVMRLNERLNYHDREKQRIKNDVGNISSSIKRL